jgi:hypothetical protein
MTPVLTDAGNLQTYVRDYLMAPQLGLGVEWTGYAFWYPGDAGGHRGDFLRTETEKGYGAESGIFRPRNDFNIPGAAQSRC